MFLLKFDSGYVSHATFPLVRLKDDSLPTLRIGMDNRNLFKQAQSSKTTKKKYNA